MDKSDQNVSTEARDMQGIEAGTHRQLIFTGLRVGGYGKVLDAILGEGRTRSDAHIVEVPEIPHLKKGPCRALFGNGMCVFEPFMRCLSR